MNQHPNQKGNLGYDLLGINQSLIQFADTITPVMDNLLERFVLCPSI